MDVAVRGPNLVYLVLVAVEGPNLACLVLVAVEGPNLATCNSAAGPDWMCSSALLWVERRRIASAHVCATSYVGICFEHVVSVPIVSCPSVVVGGP